jgi:putative tryptophan/tyrosine transport system substrate-binding protein
MTCLRLGARQCGVEISSRPSEVRRQVGRSQRTHNKKARRGGSDHPLHVRAVADLKVIAPRLSIDLGFMAVRSAEQFAQAFSEIERTKVQALYLIDDPIFFAHRNVLLQLAAAARLPTMHDLRRFPEAGALVSYGPDVYDLFRRSATYVDRIFKGAKPANLPVEQPTQFELVINLKTAKALDLSR